MKRLFYGLIFLLTAMFLGYCRNQEEEVKPTPSLTTEEEQEEQIQTKIYYIGDTMQLKINDCVFVVDTFQQDTFYMCIDSLKDGRCPFYSFICSLMMPPGHAYVYLDVYFQQQKYWLVPSIVGHAESRTCPRSSGWDGKTIDTLGHQWCVYSITPHPDTSNVIQPDSSGGISTWPPLDIPDSAYTITLKVS